METGRLILGICLAAINVLCYYTIGNKNSFSMFAAGWCASWGFFYGNITIKLTRLTGERSKYMKDEILKMVLGIVGVALVLGAIYGGYWVAKTVSYSIFYKSMVETTIKDMVKPESLK